MFVTRKFPPARGGMETLAASVWRSLRRVDDDVELIAHGGRKVALLAWVPLAVLRLVAILLRRRPRAVLVGDAFMFSLIAPLLRAAGVRHATMVMGLDVTYPRRLYRWIVHPALRRAPHVIAISRATAEAVVDIGVPRSRVSVLRLGVAVPAIAAAGSRDAARARHGLNADARVLLTIGRLVPRKGAQWFVSHVLPRLSPDTVYVVAGTGPESNAVAAAARRAGVEAHVRLLGAVDDATREELFQIADLFVQPNIVVEGDVEGFGLVVVEAAVRGLPPVASAVQGLLDAVVPGETGMLVPAGDADAWVHELERLLDDRHALRLFANRCRERARELYGEERMGLALHALMGAAAQ